MKQDVKCARFVAKVDVESRPRPRFGPLIKMPKGWYVRLRRVPSAGLELVCGSCGDSEMGASS